MNIASIIKYEGENDVLVWKHPDVDFNTNTQLIVHETQEAIFFKDGEALDLFGTGKYTLNSENIPFLKKIINLATNNESSYHCEIYFINKIESMNILWGTSSRIPVQDPIYGIIVPVGANGQFAIKIEDSRKFLIRLVGTIKSFNQQTLTDYFKGLLMTRIKDYISTQMVNNKLSFLNITTELNEISDGIKDELSREFENYGITLINFFVNSIFIPEDDPSLLQLKKALAKKAELKILGFDYIQERSFDVLDKAASNEGVGGSIAGAGLGLGVGVNLGNAVGDIVKNSVNNSTQTSNDINLGMKFCPECGYKLSGLPKFCPECGTKLNK